MSGLARALTDVPVAAPLNPWTPQGGGAGGLGRLIFTDYLFPFELTSALLITAAVGAMVLAYGGKGRGPRVSQRERANARFRSGRPSPLPGPGVYATANSVAVPALLPDGSVAPESLSELLESLPAERLVEERRLVKGETPAPDPHALTAGHHEASPEVPEQPADEPRGNGTGTKNGHGSEHATTEEVRQ